MYPTNYYTGTVGTQQNQPTNIVPAHAVLNSEGMILSSAVVGFYLSAWTALLGHYISANPTTATRTVISFILSFNILAAIRIWQYGLTVSDVLTNKNNIIPVILGSAVATITATASSYALSGIFKAIAYKKYSKLYSEVKKGKRVPAIPSKNPKRR